MPPRQIVDFLDGADVESEVLPHIRTFTAQGATASLHVKGRELARSVILRTDDGHLAIAVVPAPRPPDLGAASAVMSTKVELAREGEFAGQFWDCEVGAPPPFGNLYGMPVYVDESLREDPEIVFNGGTHDEAIRMRNADFERLVHPAAVPISRTR
jgi:Ala-tRNA(Pro) deacylase